MLVSSKEFLDIQATIECGFTLKRVRGMIRTYSHLCWSLFLIKLQVFRCFPVKTGKLLRAGFFIEHLWWLLLQMFCFTLYFQKDIAEYIVAIRCVVVSFSNLKSILFAFIHFHSLCQSLSFVVPLIVIRCHSFSFVVTLCTTRCHSMYHSSVFL